MDTLPPDQTTPPQPSSELLPPRYLATKKPGKITNITTRILIILAVISLIYQITTGIFNFFVKNHTISTSEEISLVPKTKETDAPYKQQATKHQTTIYELYKKTTQHQTNDHSPQTINTSDNLQTSPQDQVLNPTTDTEKALAVTTIELANAIAAIKTLQTNQSHLITETLKNKQTIANIETASIAITKQNQATNFDQRLATIEKLVAIATANAETAKRNSDKTLEAIIGIKESLRATPPTSPNPTTNSQTEDTDSLIRIR